MIIKYNDILDKERIFLLNEVELTDDIVNNKLLRQNTLIISLNLVDIYVE